MTPVSAKSHTIARDGVDLHHLDWGNEGLPAIVMVHGSRLHAHVWNHFSRRFKDRFHIIAVDQRGHGDSGWCPPQRYELDDFCNDLDYVIETRGLKRFTLIGHSLGGRVSMLYAHRHHHKIERLVLVDSTPGRPRSAAADADLSRITETPGPGEFESESAAIEYLGKLLFRAPAHMIEESVRHGMRKTSSGRYTWKYDPALRVRTQAPIDLWAGVQSVPTPTLLLWGSHSNVVNAELADRLGKTMPSCVVERVDDAGHSLFTDQPEVFAEKVGRFLGVGEQGSGNRV